MISDTLVVAPVQNFLNEDNIMPVKEILGLPTDENEEPIVWKDKLFMIRDRNEKVVERRNRKINETKYPRRDIQVGDFAFLRNRSLSKMSSGYI